MRCVVGVGEVADHEVGSRHILSKFKLKYKVESSHLPNEFTKGKMDKIMTRALAFLTRAFCISAHI